MPDTLTTEAVSKMIADAVKPFSALGDQLKALTENQKILADTLAADDKAKVDAAAAEKVKADAEAAKAEAAGKKPEALTAEAAQKLIGDSLAAALKARDDAAQSSAARNAFISEKLKGVPAPYAAKLGNDPAKWPAEEQAIRQSLKADLAAMGATVKDVAGGNPGGHSGSNAGGAGAPPPNPNLTPGQAKFAAGLKLPGRETAAEAAAT